MCFGSRSAPFLFSRLTDAVSRYMEKIGFSCFNYSDNFIIVADDLATCLAGQDTLISTLRSLGFYIAWNKTSYPSTLCRNLGINIDSINLRLFLPDDKINKLYSELDFWKKRRYATKKQMQRLCGTLNYCCKVIHGGRVCMHNMIGLLPCFNARRRLTLPRSFFEE